MLCDFGSDNRIEKDVERCPENYRGGTKIEIETFWPLEVAPENCFGPPENEEISRRSPNSPGVLREITIYPGEFPLENSSDRLN